MKTEKLFNILVLGGALITTPAIYAEVSEQRQQTAKILLNELLEAPAIPAIQTMCAADKPTVCVDDGTGKKVPRAGVVCCWGTSCED